MTQDDTSPSPKTPLYVDIFRVWDDLLQPTIERSGRIVARSSLTLSARSPWEISRIEVREWSQVKAGAVIARLKDTITHSDIQLSQAENALKIQNTSRNTTRINLDQSVENARISYQRAEQSHKTLLDRNSLQYDLTVSNNKKTLDAYNENFRSYLTELEKTMTQLLHEGDKILWITTVFEYANDAWEPYLGARIGSIKADSDNKWNKLFTMRGELRSRIERGIRLDAENPESDIALITRWYDHMRDFVDTMIYMLQNNVVWWWNPQAQQDAWMLAWNGYRSQVGWSESGFNAWKSQTTTFFRNYKKNELAIKLAIASLDRPLSSEEMSLLQSDMDMRVTYDTTRIDLDERIKNTLLSLEQARVALSAAESLRESTIAQLDAGIRGAELSLELARRNAENLIVRAPVAGTISRILVNPWQTVNNGAPVVDIASNEPEILLDLEGNMATALSVGSSVEIRVDDKKFDGKIIALSPIAGKNLLSAVRIAVVGGVAAIGKSATVIFTKDDSIGLSQNILIPLSAVRIVAEREWEIRYLSGGLIERQSFPIASLRWEFVETSMQFPPGMEILISDTSNFDPDKQYIVVSKS